MSDDVSSLAQSFRDEIATQTVLVERFCSNIDGTPNTISASGVIVGRRTFSCSSHIEHVNIATAAHVLEDAPTQPARWCISRVDQELNGQAKVHVATFVTNNTCDSRKYLYRPKDHPQLDVGMVTIPNDAQIQGTSTDHHVPFIDFNKHPPLQVTPAEGHLLPGSPVAWAGFPALAQRLAGAYVLCYYQGVVSAFISDRADPAHQLYLVDGHVTYGVSGGPVWFCKPDGRPVVLGVVCGYNANAGAQMPGFCVFGSMNALLDRFLSDQSAKGTTT